MEKIIEFREQGLIKNTLLLDYLLWDFTWNFENDVINGCLECIYCKYNERPEMLLRIEKVSCSELKIEIKRMDFDSKKEPVDGYFLEFVISLLGDRELPKRRVMDSSTESVSVLYNIKDMKKEFGKGTYWVIKCVIKMHEVTFLENNARRHQEELIQVIEKDNMHKEKVNDMAYLMQRESLTDIFSGRQELDFAAKKVSLIQRTLAFADDIAKKAKAKKSGTEHDTDLPADVYLRYIFNKELKCISADELLSLYKMSHYYGLQYLVDECIECMFNIVDCHSDNEYLVNILLNACMTDDQQLMNKALDVFVVNMKTVKETNAWKNLTNEKFIFAQNIQDEAMRKLGHDLAASFERLTAVQSGKEESDDKESQKSKV